jgi:hypothetical protein
MGEFRKIILELKEDEISEILAILSNYQKQYIEDFCSVLEEKKILDQNLSLIDEFQLKECVSKLKQLEHSEYLEVFLKEISKRGFKDSASNFRSDSQDYRAYLEGLDNSEIQNIMNRLYEFESKFIEELCSVLDERGAIEENFASLSDENLIESAIKLKSLGDSKYFNYLNELLEKRDLTIEKFKKQKLENLKNPSKYGSILGVIVFAGFGFAIRTCVKEEASRNHLESVQSQVQSIVNTGSQNYINENDEFDNYELECWNTLKAKLGKHQNDLDSVKKYHPNSFSDFLLKLISDERDANDFIKTNFYKTSFSDYEFEMLKLKLNQQYIKNFDSIILQENLN